MNLKHLKRAELERHILALESRLQETMDWARELEAKITYRDKAWSRVHPDDIQWMGANPPISPRGFARDWHNHVLYSYRRPSKSGVCFTGLRSVQG